MVRVEVDLQLIAEGLMKNEFGIIPEIDIFYLRAGFQ